MSSARRTAVAFVSLALGCGVAGCGGSSHGLEAVAVRPFRPDLIVDRDVLASSVDVVTRTFPPLDCALAESCVLAGGVRTLLRFSTLTANVGTADLVLGRPEERPDLFHFSECHGHYHFLGYTRYELVRADGSTVVTGRKQAFCLDDGMRYVSDAKPAQFACDQQGLSVGWADVYYSTTDCQWLDITDVPPDDYLLRVTVNPPRDDGSHSIVENNYSNNQVSIPIGIRPTVPP